MVYEIQAKQQLAAKHAADEQVVVDKGILAAGDGRRITRSLSVNSRTRGNCAGRA